MAILQIDGRGNIKGGGKFFMKVKVLSPVRIKGVSCPVGTIIDLEGDALAFLLGQQKVEPIIEVNSIEEKRETENEKTSNVSYLSSLDEKKKLGPRKRTKKVKE